MLIQFVKHRNGAVIPERATHGSLGYDLTLPETVLVPAWPCGPVLADMGWSLATDMPENMAMFILPRSSLFNKYGLIIPNSPGLVDTDYSGPIKVMLQNLRNTPVTLTAGSRIAQLVFVECTFPSIGVTLDRDPSRTRDGFGSTGT